MIDNLMDISKKLIPNTFGLVLALTIISFVVIYIWFGCSYSPERDQLKESLTLTATFFSAYATLAAAYIAANLFNDWRDEYKYKILIQYRKDLLDSARLLQDLNYQFYEYTREDADYIYKRKTHTMYLNYIWCFQNTAEQLKGYLLILSKHGNAVSSQIMKNAKKLNEDMNRNYENTKMNESEMDDYKSVSDRMNANSYLIFHLINFASEEALNYELEHLN